MTTTYTLPDLPAAETSGEQMRGPGVSINGAFHNNALVSVLEGENVPEVSFVIGINGRGTLNIPEAEFNSLLASMARCYLDRLSVRASQLTEGQINGAA